MILIALYSYGQQAGKNAAASFAREWCEVRQVPFTETSFAAKGKMLAALALGHSAADEEDWETAIAVMDDLKLNGVVGWSRASEPVEPYLSGREFIINLLEGARKLFGRDFWTEQMVLDLPITNRGCLMVTDLRRDWEADSIHEMGGIVVEIRNPRAKNAGTRVEEGIPPSCIDHVIHNAGSLVDFKITVHSFLNHIQSRL